MNLNDLSIAHVVASSASIIFDSLKQVTCLKSETSLGQHQTVRHGAEILDLMLPNEDVLRRIASYIEPDIIVYTRIAAVNRNFYKVFTSDSLWWEHFDVYGVGENIFASFRAHFKGLIDPQLLRFYWINGDTHDDPLSPRQLKLVTANQFVWLGYLMRSFRDLDYFTEFSSLVSCAVDLKYRDPRLYQVEPQFLLNNREYAIKLVRKRPELFHLFKYQFLGDYELELATVSTPRTEYTSRPLVDELPITFDDGGPRDSELAELALLNDPRCIRYVGRRLRTKYATDREWVLKNSELFPGIILICQNFKDDREVALRMYNDTPKPGATEITLCNLSERLRSDPVICKMAVDQTYPNLTYSLAGGLELFKYAQTLGDAYPRGARNLKSLYDAYGDAYMTDMEANRLKARASARSPANALSPEYLTNYDEMLELFSDPSMAPLFRLFNEEELDGVREKCGLNPEFIIKVLQRSDGSAIWSRLEDEMKRNEDVALAALKAGAALEEVEKYVGVSTFSANHELVKLSAKLTKLDQLFKIPNLFADDKEIVEIAISKRACALQYASDRLKADVGVAKLALDARKHVAEGINCICLPFKYISPKLLQDPAVFRELIELAGTCPREYMPTDENLALIVLKHCPFNYKLLSPVLKNRVEFNIKAAATNAATLRFMADEMVVKDEILAAANFSYEPIFVTNCGLCFE